MAALRIEISIVWNVWPAVLAEPHTLVAAYSDEADSDSDLMAMIIPD